MVENLKIEYIENEITIAELYAMHIDGNTEYSENGHEFIDDIELNVLGYTSDQYYEGHSEYLPVKRLIRHKVSKGKWMMVASIGDGNVMSIITTSDHGLIILDDNNTLLRLSPNDILEGGYDKIIINNMGVSCIATIHSLTQIGDFKDEYVYDIEMRNTPHTFFANDILIHNSIYITITPILNKLGIKLTTSEDRIIGKPMKITKKAMDVIREIGGEEDPYQGIITKHLSKWAKRELNCFNPEFEFKREKISKSGIFMNAKKRYVIQVIDDEGLPIHVGSSKEFSITGIDGVVSSTNAKEIQGMVTDVIKSMILHKDQDTSNTEIVKVYDAYCKLDPKVLAVRKSIKDLKKYEKNANGFDIGKGTPQNSKASLLHNMLVDHLTLAGKYEKIKSGDKVKILYVAKNKYGIKYVGFKEELPDEFKMAPDYNLLYMKNVHPVLERMFKAVSWVAVNPTKNYECDLSLEFG